MINDNEDLIKRLTLRIDDLKKLYEKEKVKSSQLQKLNSELSEQLSLKNKEIEMYEMKLNTLKLAKSLSAFNDKHDAKIKVTNLVREIDKCIALLNR